MRRKTILAVPAACFWAVVGVCLAGIVTGSFLDFEINEALANKTEIGSLFATYGSYLSYCLRRAKEKRGAVWPPRLDAAVPRLFHGRLLLQQL